MQQLKNLYSKIMYPDHKNLRSKYETILINERRQCNANMSVHSTYNGAEWTQYKLGVQNNGSELNSKPERIHKCKTDSVQL